MPCARFLDGFVARVKGVGDVIARGLATSAAASLRPSRFPHPRQIITPSNNAPSIDSYLYLSLVGWQHLTTGSLRAVVDPGCLRRRSRCLPLQQLNNFQTLLSFLGLSFHSRLGRLRMPCPSCMDRVRADVGVLLCLMLGIWWGRNCPSLLFRGITTLSSSFSYSIRCHEVL